MTTSLDDFRTRDRARSPIPEERMLHLRGLAQEAPRMAALVGTPEWDLYLRYVEANIRAAEKMVERKRLEASSLVLVDEPKAKAAAMIATVFESRAETLRELIMIPRWIRDSGAEAEKKVAELEKSA